ncbi:ribonuclease H-like domain-containing protein [Schizophyllum commune]
MFPSTLKVYVTDRLIAAILLQQYFSDEELHEEPGVGTDTEYYGTLLKQSRLAGLPMPLIAHASPTFLARMGIRLIQLCTSRITLILDVKELDGIPSRVWTIFADPSIPKVGVALHNDAFWFAYLYGRGMLNVVDLSHLYKCLHPSIDAAPLTVQYSMRDLALWVLDEELEKNEQKSDWKTKVLTVAQLDYAFKDALVCYNVYARLSSQLSSLPWRKFNANSFVFNCAYFIDGQVRTRLDNVEFDAVAEGRHVRLWGVYDDPADSTAWAPKHDDLSVWSKGVYTLCRKMTPMMFIRDLARRWMKDHIALVRDLAVYIRYRYRYRSQ